MVKVDDEIHARLVAFNAYLTLHANKQTSLSQAISELLDFAFRKSYLMEKEAKEK